MALVLIVGLPLTLWGIWLRLGRTPHARSWATGDRPERSMFTIPFFGATCVLAAAATVADSVEALSMVLMLAAAACFLIALVFGVFGAPAPAFLTPRWYRDLERQASRRPAPRAADGSATPATARTAPDVDPAWVPARDRLCTDIAALEPEGVVELRADAQHYVLVGHYGDHLSVDCTGSQAWGGDTSVTPAQEDELLALGFTTPMERRRELEVNPYYRLSIATDRLAHATEAADLAITALAILGVRPDAALDQVRS